MVLRPVGDLPPRVYWVRRVALLLVLVLVALLVWWLWPSGGGDTSANVGQQTSPTPTGSSTPSSSPEPSESKTKTATPSDEPLCADDDIEVIVRTDSSSYPAGEDPAITFSVENVSDQTCLRDVGAATNELRITSGGVTVWSSDFCSPGGEEDLRPLGPGPSNAYDQTYTWSRNLTSEGCPSPQEQADPGTYKVRARNGGVGSEPVPFTLE